jgi:Lanthionine synthetase C-like protein
MQQQQQHQAPKRYVQHNIITRIPRIPVGTLSDVDSKTESNQQQQQQQQSDEVLEVSLGAAASSIYELCSQGLIPMVVHAALKTMSGFDVYNGACGVAVALLQVANLEEQLLAESSGATAADTSTSTSTQRFDSVDLINTAYEIWQLSHRGLTDATAAASKRQQHGYPRQLTFLCGAAGIWASGIAITLQLQHTKNTTDAAGVPDDQKAEDQSAVHVCVTTPSIKDMIQNLCACNPSASDSQSSEILYGRAGFLYALLFARSHIVRAKSDNKTLPDQEEFARILLEKADDVFSTILTVGQDPDIVRETASPLMYKWHGSTYLGAAHGLSGILYVLLDEQLRHRWDPSHGTAASDALHVRKLIHGSVHYLLSKRFDSGNFATRDDGVRDRLVQWCHGSPGLSLCLMRAGRQLSSRALTASGLEAAEHVYECGMLRKGSGLCHGISGNGFCFAKAFACTNDTAWLERTIVFAHAALSLPLPTIPASASKSNSSGVTQFQFLQPQDAEEALAAWKVGLPDIFLRPDRPMSLFNGLAGLLTFVCSVRFICLKYVSSGTACDESLVKFPAFDT